MFTDFKNTYKKEQKIIEDSLWFAKNKLLPRHYIEEIEIELVRDFEIDAD